MAKTLQLRRGTTAEITANTPASGELFVDTQKKTVTVGDGSTAGGIILARDDRVSVVFTTANDANGLASGAYNQANVTIGVDTTQNTRLTVIEGVNASQNVRIDYSNTAITILQGVDSTQNTRINSIETINTNQNTSITVIQGVDLTQNTRLNSIETINSNQNTTITAVNQFAQAAFNQANTGGSDQYARNTANGAYNKANTGGTFTDSVTINQNLTVSGNVNINISSISTKTANLTSNTANQVIDSFSSLLYRTVRYVIQGINYQNVQSMGVMLSHNDSDVYIAQYDTIGSNTSLYTVSSNLSSNIVNLLVTPVNSNTFFDVVRTSLVARTLTPQPPPPPPGWSAGGTMSTGREKLAAAGTPTATLGFGGYIAGGAGTQSDATEEYDGSTWSGGGTMPTVTMQHAGAGTQSAGLSFGGLGAASAKLTEAQEYDGSAWASGGSLGSARYNHGGCGTQTAALGVGGRPSPGMGVQLAAVVLYDGTSWSTGAPTTNLAATRDYNAVFGSQTAAVTSAGLGNFFNSIVSTENWNGFVWSAGAALPQVRAFSAASGTQTAGLIFGGSAGDLLSSALTYDGSTWTATGSLTTGRSKHGGAGTAAGTGIAFGGTGGSSTSLASTEKYN